MLNKSSGGDAVFDCDFVAGAGDTKDAGFESTKYAGCLAVPLAFAELFSAANLHWVNKSHDVLINITDLSCCVEL